MKVIKKHKDHRESIELVINEVEGQRLGMVLAMMDIKLKMQPKIDESDNSVHELYLRFDYLFHKARWCVDPECVKWKVYNLEKPIAQESRKISRKENKNDI